MTLEEISDRLFEVIRPFYRGGPSSQPTFKKTIRSDEAEKLLTSIHLLLRSILMDIHEAKGA